MDGLKSALSSDPECGPNPAHFSLGEKCEKPLEFHHLCSQANDSMRKNPGLGENLGDLHEQEYQRSAPRSLLNRVVGENLEDLHFSLADPEELEIQRSAPCPLLEYPVLLEDLEDLRHLPAEPEELDCSRSASPQRSTQWPARQ